MVRSPLERLIPVLGACAVLSACGGGADDIASAGTGGNITINNTASVPASSSSSSSSSGAALATAATGCPTIEDSAGLADRGTISGPTGTYRVCELPARFTRTTTLTRIPGLLYSLGGRVDVGLDRGAAPTADAPVVLNIQPGVVIYAATGVSWLAVNRGNRINAVGTAARPIIFTSRDNVLGLVTDDSQGQWGGVVLLGRAPITDCTVAPSAQPGTVACERQTEGAVDPAYFGGATPADNSGVMQYVQIRYSGYVLSADSELQSLTNSGVGSATVIDHIQSHNSSDDAFENFGGRVSMRYLVLTGADDDNIDVDTGWRGSLQYVLAIQKGSGSPDAMIELDSANALENQTPRTNLVLSNFTFIHKGTAGADASAMLIRGGADASIMNGILVSGTQPCLRINGTNVLTANASIGKDGPPSIQSVVMQCSGGTAFTGTGGVTAAQTQGVFTAGTNNSSAFTNTLTGTGPFTDGANERAVVPFNARSVDPALDTTTYIGAVRDANDTWYAGWTCNSSFANFGSTGTACTSLPSLL